MPGMFREVKLEHEQSLVAVTEISVAQQYQLLTRFLELIRALGMLIMRTTYSAEQ